MRRMQASAHLCNALERSGMHVLDATPPLDQNLLLMAMCWKFPSGKT